MKLTDAQITELELLSIRLRRRYNGDLGVPSLLGHALLANWHHRMEHLANELDTLGTTVRSRFLEPRPPLLPQDAARLRAELETAQKLLRSAVKTISDEMPGAAAMRAPKFESSIPSRIQLTGAVAPAVMAVANKLPLAKMQAEVTKIDDVHAVIGPMGLNLEEARSALFWNSKDRTVLSRILNAQKVVTLAERASEKLAEAGAIAELGDRAARLSGAVRFEIRAADAFAALPMPKPAAAQIPSQKLRTRYGLSTKQSQKLA